MTPSLRTIGSIAVQLPCTAVVAVFLGLLALGSGSYQNTSFRPALRQYKQNPTEENKRIFQQELQLLWRDRERFALAVIVVAFAGFNTAIFACRRRGVTSETMVPFALLILSGGFVGAVLGGEHRDTWAGGVHVYSETEMFPQFVIGMAVGLVVWMLPTIVRWWHRHQGITPNPRTVRSVGIQLLLTALVALVLCVMTTANSFNDRSSLRAASRQYWEYPSPENFRILFEERERANRDRMWLAVGIVVISFVLFNAGITTAMRKLPGVVEEETIGACAVWMVVLGISAGLLELLRVHGKTLYGPFPGNDWAIPIGMAIGLALGMIPAMGRWWKSRRSSAISRR